MIDEKKLFEYMENKYNSDYNNAAKYELEETKMALKVLMDLQEYIASMPKLEFFRQKFGSIT